MASGTINGTTSNQYIAARIVWSSNADVAANKSTVSASLQLYKSQPAQYKTWGTGTWTISINGAPVTFSTTVELYDAKGWVTLGTHTVTVSHNADGSKSVAISASGGIPSTTYTSTNVSATVALDTIPRASSISCGTLTMGSAGTISISRASSSFTHTILWSYGSASGTITTKTTATSVSWTPPTATLAPQVPSATSGTGTLTCVTYSGNAEIGRKSISVKINVPSSVKPTVSAVTATEATSGLAAKFAAFVQGKSTLKVAISAAGIYGSTIKSYSVNFDGKSYSGNNCTTQPPGKSGNLTLTATVTDTRGRTASKSITVTVLPYASPAITGLTVWRCDADGNADDSGDYVGITYAYAIASVGGKNDAAAKIEYKRSTGTAWTELLTNTAYSANTTVHPETELLSDYQWDIRLTIEDYFGSTSMTATLPSAEVLLDLLASGDGMGIGKTSELTNTLDIAWAVKMRNGLVVNDGPEVSAELKRIGGGYTNAGEICVYDSPTHSAGVSYDNTYGVYVDGTTPAVVIDGYEYTLLRRSQFNYKTAVNLDNIIAGVYWINGYSSTVSGSAPFTNVHYILISTGVLSNRFQLAVSAASGHTIKTRYYASGAWTSWV